MSRPIVKFRKFFNISATAEARNFKFGVHAAYEEFYLQDAKLGPGA